MSSARARIGFGYVNTSSYEAAFGMENLFAIYTVKLYATLN